MKSFEKPCHVRAKSGGIFEKPSASLGPTARSASALPAGFSASCRTECGRLAHARIMAFAAPQICDALRASYQYFSGIIGPGTGMTAIGGGPRLSWAQMLMLLSSRRRARVRAWLGSAWLASAWLASACDVQYQDGWWLAPKPPPAPKDDRSGKAKADSRGRRPSQLPTGGSGASPPGNSPRPTTTR